MWEKVLAAAHEVQGTSIVVNVAEIHPPVAQRDVERAARRLQGHHPLLRACLVREGLEAFFDCTAGAGGEVEVRAYDCPVEDAVHKELLEQLPSRRCGWRLAVCGAHLLLAYNHAFFDGTSVMVILEDLLEVLGGGEPAGEPLLGLPPPLAESLPWGMLALVPRGDRSYLPEVGKWPDPEAQGAWDARRTNFLRLVLPPEDTSRLRERCRAEGTTVQGALAAAACLAITAALRRSDGPEEGCQPPISIATYVNVRGDCGWGRRELGLCIGGLQTLLKADAPFWALARRHRADLERLVANRYHLWWAVLPDVANYDSLVRSFADTFALRPPQRYVNSIDISNRGAFEVSSRSHRLTSLHWARQSRWCDEANFFTLNACTVGGALCLTLCYVSPACSDRTARAAADAILSELRGACGAATGAGGE